MFLTIVLRKEVADTEAAKVLTDIVRAKLAEHPEITISATVSEPIPEPEAPE